MTPKPPQRQSKFPGVYPSGANHWQYKIRLPRDPVTGKRPMETRGGFLTDEDAHNARLRRTVQIMDGIATRASTQTMAEYLKIWLDMRVNIKPSTRHLYAKQIRKYINPVIGHIRVQDITAADVEAVMARLRVADNRLTGKGMGLSASTAIGVRNILVASLNKAVVTYKTIPFNPALSVEAPELPSGAPKCWNQNEIDRAIAEIDRDVDSMSLFWTCLLYLQMRPGEVMGLRRREVSVANLVLDVTGTRSRDRDGRIVRSDTPKTPHSRRSIPFTKRIGAMFASHFAKQDEIARHMPADWNPEGYVFPSSVGGMMSNYTVSHRLRKFCDRADVTQITPHGLRHSGATWMARLKMSPALISDRLGHSTPNYTLTKYVHHSDEDQRKASDELDGGEAAAG